jgi:hypothetical protein
MLEAVVKVEALGRAVAPPPRVATAATTAAVAEEAEPQSTVSFPARAAMARLVSQLS